MAGALTKICTEEENNPELAHLGKHWLANFLNCHPKLSAKFGAQLDRQQAYTTNITVLKDYFAQLIRLIRTCKLQPEDIFNMDEKGFIIGFIVKGTTGNMSGRVVATTGDTGWNVADAYSY